ncbi:MAG: multidrug MFS transporter [Clostridium sp.]|nr:multidrug MFS transporter [Acetatifactor muris]MCM1563601.1 multidrug MFS transporter [Clostridium sp.]
MIFVTVGTHEQQFDRLIQAMDGLKEQGLIGEEVIMQTGFSDYEPRFCSWQKLFPYDRMKENIERASIVVTHGGPASFLMPLQSGKIPIVVPRQKRYGEHVNDHQLEFCRLVEERMGNIIVVEDIGRLSDVIAKYEEYCRERNGEMSSHNRAFNERLEEMVREWGV